MYYIIVGEGYRLISKGKYLVVCVDLSDKSKEVYRKIYIDDLMELKYLCNINNLLLFIDEAEPFWKAQNGKEISFKEYVKQSINDIREYLLSHEYRVVNESLFLVDTIHLEIQRAIETYLVYKDFTIFMIK